jgi:hypothetical protein
MSGQDIGTLYVLGNRDSSLAKLGMTRTGTPDMRASQYETVHGIAWHVYWFATTANIAQVEARCHRELANRRFSLLPEAREIFHCVPAVAQRVAERFVIPTDIPRAYAPESSHSAWLDALGTALSLGHTMAGQGSARRAPARILSRWLVRFLARHGL